MNIRSAILFFSLIPCITIAANDVLFSTKVKNTTISVVKGDLLQEPVDAIVNAANDRLQHGGGIAAAICQKGGPIIQQQSNLYVTHGPIPIGTAIRTDAGNLPCKFVIHAVGPDCRQPEQNAQKEKLLTDAYTRSLTVANYAQCKSIAFCAISTDIFGYDINAATPVAIKAIVDWLLATKTNYNVIIKEIRLVIFDKHPSVDAVIDLYKTTLKQLNPQGTHFEPHNANQQIKDQSLWQKLFSAPILIPATIIAFAVGALGYWYYKKQTKKSQ